MYDRQCGSRVTPLDPLPVGLYKIFVYFKVFFCTSESYFSCPSPSASALPTHTVAVLLHEYCAINDPPQASRLYAIHHTILVITISCNGQLAGTVAASSFTFTHHLVGHPLYDRDILCLYCMPVNFFYYKKIYMNNI